MNNADRLEAVLRESGGKRAVTQLLDQLGWEEATLDRVLQRYDYFSWSHLPTRWGGTVKLVEPASTTEGSDEEGPETFDGDGINVELGANPLMYQAGEVTPEAISEAEQDTVRRLNKDLETVAGVELTEALVEEGPNTGKFIDRGEAPFEDESDDIVRGVTEVYKVEPGEFQPPEPLTQPLVGLAMEPMARVEALKQARRLLATKPGLFGAESLAFDVFDIIEVSEYILHGRQSEPAEEVDGEAVGG